MRRALALLIALAPLPFAALDDGGVVTLPAPRGNEALKELSGRVSSMDREAHLLTVETSSGAVTLRVNRDTTVFVPGHVGTMLAVQPGVELRGAYEATGNPPRAAWLEVTAAARDAGALPERTSVASADAGGADAGARDAGAAPDGGAADAGR